MPEEESVKHTQVVTENTPNYLTRMTLDTLLTKNGVELSPLTKTFCDQGISRIRNSADPAHNVGHLERMIFDLDKFVEGNKDLEIDFETLLISISWHDVWIAQNFRPNLVDTLRSSYTEGPNAAKLVGVEMEKAGFEQNLIDNVKYCVENHPGPEASKTKRVTTESRILHDLDQMDSWSEERLKDIKSYLSGNPKGKLVLPLLRLGRSFILKAANHDYYFESSRREKDRRYPRFVKQVEELFG